MEDRFCVKCIRTNPGIPLKSFKLKVKKWKPSPEAKKLGIIGIHSHNVKNCDFVYVCPHCGREEIP